MPEMPRFSVTIPAYNAASTLQETITSVRTQTFEDWELVIVDDGSIDDTLQLARDIAAEDARIRVLTQENRGSGGAYNTAVRASASDLLVMLSADDLLLPGHLAGLCGLLESDPGAAVFTCNGYYEYQDGTRELVDPQAQWAEPTRCTLEELLQACFFGVGAVYRRAVYEAVGGFREDTYAEDYAFWLLAFAYGYEHRHTVEPLSVHRRTAVQKSADAIAMRETDARVIREIVSTGLLGPDALAVAQRSLDHLEHGIRIRRMAHRLLGPERAERLIAWRRRRASSGVENSR